MMIGFSESLVILIADDDQRVLDAFARNLAQAGYQVLTAAGGREALEVYREATPDVALVDIRMPHVDGLEVLKTIREQDPESEIILTTGHGDKNLVIAALRAGASDFISKPIDQITLDAALQRVRKRMRLREELHAAQAALEASEERYRLIVETVPDVITTIDREGTILFINRPIDGLIEEDLVGKNTRDFLPPAEQETAMREIEHVFATGESKSFTIESPRTNEWYENRIGPVWQKGRVVAVTIISTNITERIEREHGLENQVQERTAQLRGEEARFQAVFEAAQDSIFIKDDALRYVDVNPAMERLFGTPAEDLLGKTDTEIFGATAGEHIEAVDAQVLQGTVVEEEDTKPVNGVMRTFHVIKVPIRDEAGEIVGLCGIARDITDRKEMERELQEHAESLERMVLAKAHEPKSERQKRNPNVVTRPGTNLPVADSDRTEAR